MALAHQDTFDLKTDAPSGIRGEFKPISTRVPGIQVCEFLPRTAAIMDKIAVIRSLVGQIDEHSSFQSMTGFPMGISQREGRPHFGSVISRMQGAVDPVVPPIYRSLAGHAAQALQHARTWLSRSLLSCRAHGG